MHVDLIVIIVVEHVTGKRTRELHRQEILLERDQVDGELMQFDVLVVQKTVQTQHVIALDRATWYKAHVVLCILSVFLLPEHLLDESDCALEVWPQTVDKLGGLFSNH